MTTHIRCLLFAAMLLMLTIPLHADLLNPGDSVSPVTGVAVPSNILTYIIDETTQSFNFGGVGVPHLTGYVDEVVLTGNPFGLSCPTCLDFAFSVSVDSGQPFSVYQALFGSFLGYTTNVVYAQDTGDVTPGTAFRGPGGGGVGELFGTVGAPTLGPGQSSMYLIIGTNATSYNNFGSAFINGSDGQVSECMLGHCRGGVVNSLFQPTPEPSSMLLVSTLLLGLFWVMRKRVTSRLAARLKD